MGNTKEIWKDIKGYNNYYKISNLGRVKSKSRHVNHSSVGLKVVNEKILKQTPSSNGYLSVSFYEGKKRVTKFTHRLVAEYFLGHSIGSYIIVVNHKNFNKIDNRCENLEIISQRVNANKKHIKGTSKYIGVSLYKKNNKWVSKILVNGKSKHLGYFDTEIEASQKYQSELKKI